MGATISYLGIIGANSCSLLGLCIGGFQMLFGVRYKNKPLKYSLNLLITAAIISLVYLGYVTAENFSTSGSYQQKHALPLDSSNQVKVIFDIDEHF